jgi:hypothetical protein
MRTLESELSEHDKTSVRYELRQLIDGQSPNELKELVFPTLELLNRVLVAYYTLGIRYKYTSPEVLAFVEIGVCRLTRTISGDLRTCITEPLTAWSIYCFFRYNLKFYLITNCYLKRSWLSY